MENDIFNNSIFLKFKEKKIEKKFSKHIFSEKRMLLVIIIVLASCFTNTIIVSNFNSAITNQILFNKNKKENINSSFPNLTLWKNETSLNSYDEFLLLSNSEQVISQIKNFNYFAFLYLCFLLLFRIIIIFLPFNKNKNNLKNKKHSKKHLEFKSQNYDNIFLKNVDDENIIIENKNNFIKKENNELNLNYSNTNFVERKDEKSLNLKKFKFFLNLNLHILLSFMCVYQFDVFKFICVFYFEEFKFYYFLCSFEIILYVYLINFVYSDHILISLGLLIAKLLKFLYLKKILNSKNNNFWDTDLNIYNIVFVIIYLITNSHIAYKVNLNNKLYFYFRYVSKLDLEKTTDILENLNSGFISFGQNMQFNYNKKFSQIFTNLVNDIFSTEKKNENTISLLKTLKLEEHLDEGIKSKNTAKFFENEQNEKLRKSKTKKSSMLNMNKTYQYESSKDVANYNHLPIDQTKNSKELRVFSKSKKGKSHDSSENNFSCDIILLLLFFDKENIHINQNLDPEIIKFIEEKIYINLNSDEVITEIINFDFLSNIQKINKISKPVNQHLEKTFEINKILHPNFSIKQLYKSLADCNKTNKSRKMKSNQSQNPFILNGFNYYNHEINNLPELHLKNIHDITLNNSYSNFLNNFSFNNPILENKFKQRLSTQSINNFNKQEFNNINLNFFYGSNININNDFNKDNNFINHKSNEKSGSDINYSDNINCEFNLNKAFFNYLNIKKANFSQLINLIKDKYYQQNEFFTFFTFKKKYEDEEGESESMHIKVYLRYNNLSDKIELLFNDLSYVLKIANFKAQNKIKKKFLKKFSHEFRNPLLNIVQLIKNIKDEKYEKLLSKNSCFQTINPVYPNNFSSSIINNSFNINEVPKEISTKEEINLHNEHQGSDREKTIRVSKIDFETVAATAKSLLEKENLYYVKNKNYSLSSSNSNFTNREKNDGLIRSKKILEKINAKILLDTTEDKFLSCSPTNNIDIIKKNQIQKSTIKDNKCILKKSLIKENQTFIRSPKNINRKNSNNSINPSNNNNNNKIQNILYVYSDSLKYKNSDLSKKYQNSLELKMTNFNHIKFTCYYLNYLISDFDFITNHDLNDNNNKISSNKKNKIIKMDSFIMLEKNKYEKNEEVYKQICTDINIHKLFRKMVNIFKSKLLLSDKKIDINLEIDDSVPTLIKSSLEKITQILFNLLSNSMKFTKFGCINLKVIYENSKAKLIFNIFDTGIGIKEKLIKNIFKPFFKCKDDKNNIYGMGLGLYIVKLHVESLNGEIIVESKESKYTNVNFYIITEKNEVILKKNLQGSYEDQNLNDEELINFKKNNKNNNTRKVYDLIEHENYKFSNDNSNQKYKSITVDEKNRCFKNTRFSKLENTPQKETESQRIYHNVKNIYPEIYINNNTFNLQRCKTYLKETMISKSFLEKDNEIYENINNSNNLFRGSSEISRFKNFKSLFYNNQEKFFECLNPNNLYHNKGEKNCNIYHTIISEKFKTDNINISPKYDITSFNSQSDLSINSFRRNKTINFKGNLFLKKNFTLDVPKKNLNNIKIDDKLKSKTGDIQNRIHDAKESQNSFRNKSIISSPKNFKKTRISRNYTDNIKNQLFSKETVDFESDLHINYNLLKTLNENNKNIYSNIINDGNSESNYSYMIGTPEINKRILERHSNSLNKSNINAMKNSDPKLKQLNKKENILTRLYNPEINKTDNLPMGNESNINCKNNNKSEIFFNESEITIIVVDDEKLIRQSNINLIKKYFKNKSTTFQVFECEDGFSCLDYIYKAKLVGKEIDYIITDQTMNHITGTLLSEIIGLLIEHKVINDIRMFLLTSYSANIFNKQENRFIKVFSKPFRLEHLEFIFKDY